MAIETVDIPIRHCGSFHSYVKLPEGSRDMNGIEINGGLIWFGLYMAIPSGNETWLAGKSLSNRSRIFPAN